MEYPGLIGAVILLIWLALRGVDIIFAALACSVLVIATNGLPLVIVLLTIILPRVLTVILSDNP